MGDRSKGVAAPYLLNVEGLPESYTWRDTKDLVRIFRPEDDFTADLNSIVDPDKGRMAFVRVQTKEIATKLYDDLTTTDLLMGEKIKHLTVHLWHYNQSKWHAIRCNCGKSSALHNAPGTTTMLPSVPQAASSRSIATTSGPRGVSSTSQGGSAPQHSITKAAAISPAPIEPRFTLERLTSWMYAHRLDPRNPEHVQHARAAFLQAYQAAQSLTESAANDETASQDATRAAGDALARKVRVGGLPSAITEHRVRDLFTRAGEIVSVAFDGDPVGREPRSAAVEFETLRGAQEALRMYDGLKINAYTLSVKPLATNFGFPTAVQEPEYDGPVIVNGTNRRP